MAKTELTAQKVRELAEYLVWQRRISPEPYVFSDRIAAALEQFAGLLEQEATAVEALKACQCENCTRLMPSVAAGEKMDAARLLRSQLAAERERARELEEKVAKHDQVKQSYTCPFCEEVYGPNQISLDALRAAVALHAPTCADHPLTKRIVTLERENARLKQEHETGISTRAAMARSVTELERELAEALQDAERYQALRAILQGDALVLNTGLGTPALRSLARMEHALTDCTAEEIDEAIDAARVAQERDAGGGRRGEPRDT